MKNKHVLQSGLLVCATVCCALPVVAHATAFTPSLFANSSAYFANPSSGVALLPEPCSNLSGGTLVTCNGSAATPEFATTNATFNYQGTATAAYGVLKAGGSSSISGANGTSDTTYHTFSGGSSSFQDSWVITGGTGTGTLDLQFALDGTYGFCEINSGSEFGFGGYNYTSGTSFADSNPGAGIFSSCSGAVSQNVTLSTGFAFGTPMGFSVNLTAGSALFSLGQNISSFLNLSDTAAMSSIIVKDANGNVIPFDLTPGSGASLFSQLAPGIPGNSVPEPSSLALFTAGLLGLLGLAAMRGRKSHAT